MKTTTAIFFAVLMLCFNVYSTEKEGIKPTSPYDYECKMIQSTLQDKAIPFLIEDRPLNLTTNKHSSQWMLYFCTNCQNKKLDSMEYVNVPEESVTPWVIPETMELSRDLIGDKVKLEKIYQAAKSFGCADLNLEQDIKKEKRRILYSPNQYHCISKALMEEIKKRYTLGSGSMDILEESKNLEFKDFYQTCYKEMNKTPIRKGLGNLISALKSFRRPASVEEDENKQDGKQDTKPVNGVSRGAYKPISPSSKPR
ncbi:MAG: hypothetical protein K2Q18_02475 [Bdellovibrionales bacterium]|nr:hypothetical protein [Bdellovibrionales bacterium]